MRHNIGNGSALLALATIAAMATACGDGPTCPSDLVVVFQSPSADGSLSSVNDSDATAAGIQTDVILRTNFAKGDEFVLNLRDASGAVAQSDKVKADSAGNVVFSKITFPAGEVTATVKGTSATGCGTGSDEIVVTVITDTVCDLSVDEGPLPNDFFAPIPVLNATNDSDSTAGDFQANLTVQTLDGFSVEVFVLDVGTGEEISLGVEPATSAGVAKFATTLGQGRRAIRATCTRAGANASSATSTVEIDTVVPTCTLTAPAEGVTVTPDDDSDGDILNGIQMTWRGTVDDGGENDTVGEIASFFRDSVEYAGIDVTASGDSETGLAEFTAPGTFAVSFVTSDHSGNPCVGGFDVPVIMEGCSITIDQPSALVIADSDANDANGMQADFVVTVGRNPIDTGCEGLDVIVECGQGESTGVVAVGGVTTVAGVSLSADSTSEGNYDCTARVTNSANYQTSDQRNVRWDTEAPVGDLSLVSPALVCGDSLALSLANDADSNLANGFQIGVAVIAPTATVREVSVNNSVGLTTIAAPEFGVVVNVTLEPGDNDIRAITTDGVGNSRSTFACNIRLEDIFVTFDDPAGTGTLNAAAGTVNSGVLSAPICVTSNDAAVTVTITLDGMTNFSTQATGNTFCTVTPVDFSEGAHTLTALATALVGTRQGSRSQAVTVDVTPPTAPGTLDVQSSNHQTLDVSWASLAGVTYSVRYGTVAFAPDPATFATQGIAWNGSTANGVATINPVDAGTGFFVGVVAIDAAGNPSLVSNFGPVTPDYDATGALVPSTGVDLGAQFGKHLVAGDFNGDTFTDVAVAAPFNLSLAGEVYIYYGSASGLATPGFADITPDVILRHTAGFALFGYDMTRIDWDGSGDGLVVSSPFTDKVFVFHNGTLAAGSTAGGAPLVLSETAANVTIGINGTNNYFTGGLIGLTLASGQLDAVGTPEDLIIGVPGGGIVSGKNLAVPGGDGGVLVIYGGTMTAGSTITLSETATSADMLGLAGMIVENPQSTVNGSTFAHSLAYLGDTRTGNGVGDFSVGYASDTLTGISDNVVYVFRGRTLLVPGMTYSPYLANTDLKIVNPTADETNEFGITMSSIADQNGDGFRDIVIGAFRDSGVAAGINDDGRLWILSGSSVGSVTLTGPADYLTKISGGLTYQRVGTALANNALTANADVNGDGREDLVCSSTQGTLIWYGGSIPTGDATAAGSVSYVKVSSPGFVNNFSTDATSKTPVVWLTDVNGDGLADLARSDWFPSSGTIPNPTGIFEVLFDL